MPELSSAQRKALRGQAHHLEPIVLIGKSGITETLVRSTGDALQAHELIKIRFNDFKDQKKEMTAELAKATESEVAGIIGHVAILYRENEKPEKRKITIPKA